MFGLSFDHYLKKNNTYTGFKRSASVKRQTEAQSSCLPLTSGCPSTEEPAVITWAHISSVHMTVSVGIIPRCESAEARDIHTFNLGGYASLSPGRPQSVTLFSREFISVSVNCSGLAALYLCLVNGTNETSHLCAVSCEWGEHHPLPSHFLFSWKLPLPVPSSRRRPSLLQLLCVVVTETHPSTRYWGYGSWRQPSSQNLSTVHRYPTLTEH